MILNAVMCTPSELPASANNQLLSVLPLDEYEKLLPHLEPVHLSSQQILYLANHPIEYVYFPQTSVISLLTLMDDGTTIEVATVGKEGMVGLSILLGVDRVPSQATAQIPGLALRMRAASFQSKVGPDSVFHRRLQRYSQTLFNQLVQSSACNRLHSIEQRFCRWLLMSHDRVGSNEFLLKQESLAQMLGVRRAGVSVVANLFQKTGAISYSRGKLKILDRTQLEASTCECYAKIYDEFEQLATWNP